MKKISIEPQRLEETFDMIFGNGVLFAVACLSLLLILVNVFL